MLQNTQAIILKVNPKGETSAILHCFSRDFGKLILIAKGARSSKSQFKGLIEPFSLLNVHFNEKKDRAYQFLSSAEYIASYSSLKSKPEAVLYGSIILEIMYKESEIQANPPLFDLINRVFHAMNNGASAQMAHWHFILKYLEMEGLPLNTISCYLCEEGMKNGYFYPRTGEIRCPDCHEDLSLSWELDEAMMSLLRELSIMTADDIPDQIDSKIDKNLINRILWNTLATRFDTCRKLKSVEILRKIL